MAFAALCSACGPRPARSSIIMRNPPALPMPCTAGGWTTTTKASWITARRLNNSPCSAAADLRGSRARSSNGSSTAKNAPAFGACVKVAPENPDDVDPMRHARRAECDVGDAPHDLVGARQRGTGRQLRRDDEEAAVDLRDEADRRLAELVEPECQQAGVEDDHQGGEPHRAGGEPAVAGSQRIEAPVEDAEETVHRPLVPAVAVLRIVRLQQAARTGPARASATR